MGAEQVMVTMQEHLLYRGHRGLQSQRKELLVEMYKKPYI